MEDPQDGAVTSTTPPPHASPRSSVSRTGGARPVNLRVRLALIALLAMVLVVAERSVSIVQLRRDNLSMAKDKVLDLLDRTTARYDQTLLAARTVLVTLTAVEPPRELGDEGHASDGAWTPSNECQRLDDVLQRAPMFGSMAILGRDGRVRCATLQGAVGLDLSSRSYFHLAMRGLGSVEALESNYFNGLPSVMAVQPIVGAGDRPAGAYLGRIGLTELFPQSLMGDLGVGSFAMVVSPAGRVMVAYPDGSVAVGEDLASNPAVARALSSTRGTLVASGPEGTRRVYAYDRLAGTNMHLVVGMDEALVEGSVERATWRAGLTMLAVSALMLIALWLAGEHLIVRPVQALADRLIRFGRGEHANGPPEHTVSRIVELQPLIIAFEDMAEELTRREAALREANRRLDSLASLDPLTGIANRRSFDAVFALQWSTASQLALLLIDIDSFKAFNDHYGHREGDRCIRAVAAFLAAEAGNADIAARIGGEEFAILLPGASLAAALELGERLRRGVEALAITHAERPSGIATVSIGAAACVPEPHLSPADLFVAADLALYRAKNDGRNRVCMTERVTQGLAMAAPASKRRGSGIRSAG